MFWGKGFNLPAPRSEHVQHPINCCFSDQHCHQSETCTRTVPTRLQILVIKTYNNALAEFPKELKRHNKYKDTDST